jgi:hypothetical protein
MPSYSSTNPKGPFGAGFTAEQAEQAYEDLRKWSEEQRRGGSRAGPTYDQDSESFRKYRDTIERILKEQEERVREARLR